MHIGNKGFTLVELIATIFILGILAVIAGRSVFTIIYQQRESLLEEQMQSLGDTAITYVIQEKYLLDSCGSNVDPANLTNTSCYKEVLIEDLISNDLFENKNDLCDPTKKVIVYKEASGLSTVLKSYVAEGICGYKKKILNK